MTAAAATERVNLLGLPKAELEAFVGELGSKPFRARQIMHWLYKRGQGDIAEMTDLAKDFRAQLAEHAEIAVPKIVKTQVASDGTRKWLLSGGNDQAFEMVFIPEEDRGTLCISSQVGCVLDCTFCATAQQGFNRNLTTAEIVGQVWLANRELAGEIGWKVGDESLGRKVSGESLGRKVSGEEGQQGGVDLRGGFQPGQVAGLVDHDQFAAGDQFVDQLGVPHGRVRILGAHHDQRRDAYAGKGFLVVGSLGPAPQRGGGTPRRGREHHPADVRGDLGLSGHVRRRDHLVEHLVGVAGHALGKGQSSLPGPGGAATHCRAARAKFIVVSPPGRVNA